VLKAWRCWGVILTRLAVPSSERVMKMAVMMLKEKKRGGGKK